MTEYNRTQYTDRIQTPTPGHQPIYMQVPLNWIANLTTQVTPRDLIDPGVASPLLVGVASRSGAILETLYTTGVGRETISGGGGSGGGSSTSIDWGVGNLSDPTYLNLYTRREPDERIYWVNRIPLPTIENRASLSRFGFPILPQPEVAWRLEPMQEIYIGLSRAVPNPGVNVFILGGHYS